MDIMEIDQVGPGPRRFVLVMTETEMAVLEHLCVVSNTFGESTISGNSEAINDFKVEVEHGCSYHEIDDSIV